MTGLHISSLVCSHMIPHFQNKKRHIPKKCPSLRLPQRYKHTHPECAKPVWFGHTDPKNVFVMRLFLKW